MKVALSYEGAAYFHLYTLAKQDGADVGYSYTEMNIGGEMAQSAMFA